MQNLAENPTFSPPPSPTLADWFATPQGQYLLTREQAYFDHSVADIFGYNALQMGLPQFDFLNASRMPMRVTVGSECEAKVRLDIDYLPFCSDSIDLVLMPHVLEFNEHPHQILREVVRALRPEGNLIISGFNPRSLWGARRTLDAKMSYPWCGNFIALSRLKDWLALLGCELVAGRFTAYAPPLKTDDSLTFFNFMEPAGDRWWAVFGGVYFLQATKRVAGMHLIKPKWKEGFVTQLMPGNAKLNNKITQCSVCCLGFSPLVSTPHAACCVVDCLPLVQPRRTPCGYNDVDE